MSRYTSNGSDGNDGTWFLEAVGAKPRAQLPSEAVAELTAENTLADIPVVLAPDSAPTQATAERSAPTIIEFDGDPGTSTSSFHPVPVPPPAPDLEHPDAAGPDAITPPDLEGPPTDELPVIASPLSLEDETRLSPALRSRRSFRWPVVVMLVLAIGAVAVGAWWLPRSVNDSALATRQSYYDAAAGVRNFLPTSQAALDDITNPGSDTAAVASSVPVIAELDRLAFDLEAVTGEPLPNSLPFVPTGPIDELVPLRDTGSILGDSASDLARRLGNAYVYRTSIPQLLETGPLPSTATTQEVNAISVLLAGSLAEDASLLSELPDDPAFADVRTAAVAAVGRYAAWQDDYLGALTAEDATAATNLIGELDGIRRALTGLNDEALLAFRSEADLWIVRLASELETYMGELTEV